MITVKENTTIIGVSELRTKLDKVLKASKYSKIIINQRNKPVAVLMDIDVYNRLDDLIEEWSDQQLAHEAKERVLKSKRSDYISSAQARKRLGF